MNLDERQFLESRLTRLEDKILEEMRRGRAETNNQIEIIHKRINHTNDEVKLLGKGLANNTGKLTVLVAGITAASNYLYKFLFGA